MSNKLDSKISEFLEHFTMAVSSNDTSFLEPHLSTSVYIESLESSQIIRDPRIFIPFLRSAFPSIEDFSKIKIKAGKILIDDGRVIVLNVQVEDPKSSERFTLILRNDERIILSCIMFH